MCCLGRSKMRRIAEMPILRTLVLLFFSLCSVGGYSFAQQTECPPECVTDTMEIVTWYPSPYSEYEKLRLYPKVSAAQ